MWQKPAAEFFGFYAEEHGFGRKIGSERRDFCFLEGDVGLYIMGNAGRSNRVIIYIYARQTYPQFVAKFGGRATHYKNIRKKRNWLLQQFRQFSNLAQAFWHPPGRCSKEDRQDVRGYFLR